MIREKNYNRVIFDLTKSSCNAFFLLGSSEVYRRVSGFSATKIKNICDEMTSGDYENLVSVFDNHFGDYVILEVIKVIFVI